MDWTQVIIALLGTGGFVGLFLISEKKAKAQIANMQVMIDNYKEQSAKYLERNKELFEENKTLNKQLIATERRASIAELKVCNNITCVKRTPPLADTWSLKVIDVRDEDNC